MFSVLKVAFSRDRTPAHLLGKRTQYILRRASPTRLLVLIDTMYLGYGVVQRKRLLMTFQSRRSDL